jgi:hypothetical protein
LQRLYATRDGAVFVGAQPEQLGSLLGALGAAPRPATDNHAIEPELERLFSERSTSACVDLLRGV